MLFTILPEHGIKRKSLTIWDAETNAPLCEFVDGQLVTEDETVVAKLEALGYVGAEVGEEAGEPEPEVNEEKLLRDKAKELGIKSYHLKSVETLTAEIAKIESAEVK